MSTLINIGGAVVDKDQILSVTYIGGKARIAYRTGHTQDWTHGEVVRRALAPWLARPDDADTIATLRPWLVTQTAQALRADDKLGPLQRARGATQTHYRQRAEAWVRTLLGEESE
jgi:hypothetical protein